MDFLKTNSKRALEIKSVEMTTDRTVQIAFSSETPVKRSFGYEVLDHSVSAIDLSRLLSGAPLLLEHDTDVQIGVVEAVEIGADRIARAIVRFSKSQQAEEIYQDVLDLIRRNVSVAYEILEAKRTGTRDDQPVFTITKWSPYELSIVSVPADYTVGVGRSMETVETEIVVTQQEPSTESTPEAATLESVVAQTEEVRTESDTSEVQTQTTVIEIIEVTKSERKMTDKNKDISEMLEIGKRHNKLDEAMKFVSEGKTLDEFRSHVLSTPASAINATQGAEIGLTDKETRGYDLAKAIMAQGSRNWKDAGFEREVSEAVEKKLGRSARGFFIPEEVLKRAFNKGNKAEGGQLVDTTLDTASFVSLLHEKLVVAEMGATYKSGLVGDLEIPTEASDVDAFWVSEGADYGDTTSTFDSFFLKNKSIGASTLLTRTIQKQSSMNIESFVMSRLANKIARGIDYAALFGNGQNGQPLGLLNQAGINILSLGANGAKLTWADIIALETEVAANNADIGSLGYVTNARVRGALKSTTKVAEYPEYIWSIADQLNGYKAMASNQIPGNLSKGTGTDLSAMIFGNWSDLWIGAWGGLDMIVDPYSRSKSGSLVVTAMQDIDVAVARPQSFAAYKDIKV
jgi:HK97 family phage major capsid protein